MRERRFFFSLVGFILICFAVQVLGGLWTRETVSTWYPALVKPSWTPPSWLFPPVWSTLYLMIALSGWLIYRAEYSRKRSIALLLFGLQLACNFIWSFFFFSMQSPLLALIDIVTLCLLITLTIIKAWPLTPVGSLLLIPYLLWTLYATSLNAAIWFLNR